MAITRLLTSRIRMKILAYLIVFAFVGCGKTRPKIPAITTQDSLPKLPAESASETIASSENDSPHIPESNPSPQFSWLQTFDALVLQEDTPIEGVTFQAQGGIATFSLDEANMSCDDGFWSDLGINPETGQLKGTPANGDVGTCTIKILGQSGLDVIAHTITVIVNNTDDAPEWINRINLAQQYEDLPLDLSLLARDEDVDSEITYSLDTETSTCDDGSFSPPLSIDGKTGRLSGTPTNQDVGRCVISAIATSDDQQVQLTFSLDVIAVTTDDRQVLLRLMLS